MKPLMQCTRPLGARHGDYAAYQQGCRCTDAREDHRLYQKRLREGRNQPRIIDGTGTHRRIRALAAIGHATSELSIHLGHSDAYLRMLCSRDTVTLRSAQLVRELYDQLSMTAGTSESARRRAARAGWAPPLAWDDDTIDNPAAQPEGVGFQPSHQRAEITHGTEAGAKAHERAGEKPCAACRTAATQAQADRRAARRAAA